MVRIGSSSSSGIKRKAVRAEQWFIIGGHILREHDRLRAIDPQNPRIKPSLPVSALTDPELQPRPRRGHIFPPDSYGHYIDPAWCSNRLFETEDFGPHGASVLDPCCGWGTISRAARDAGSTDFLKDDPPIRAPWSIVCNPPFDSIQQFCERAVDLVTFKAALLILHRRLPAAGGWLRQLPLQSIVFLTPRPSMPPASYIAAGNQPGNGREDFAWLIFNKQTPFDSTRVRWLHRDGGAS
jgi:hypothetical protein